ncbi:MAG: efflux RND transporter periplasmic adaptor subunit [Armatimonadetes bacterium]|nr:efflux RND transporter periplasmic adaptor subunit [Armatimonadota bacterium]
MTRLYWLSVLVVFLSGCRPGPVAKAGEPGHGEDVHEETGHSEEIVLTREAVETAGIQVATVRRLPVQMQIEAPGTVSNTSQGRAVVTPPVAGKVVRLLVKVGDTVRAGQALVVMQSSDLALAAATVTEGQKTVMSARGAVDEAVAGVKAAESRLATSEQSLARQRNFAKTGAFSQPALQAAQRELADAEAELERGRQDQGLHQAQLERAERLYRQELISRTELEQARLEVATDTIRQKNAERRIDLAKSAFQREQRIVEQNLTNAKEVQTAEGDVRAARQDLQQARIRHEASLTGLRAAQRGLQAAQSVYRAQAGNNPASGGTVTVTSPIGGVVTERTVTIGQAVERTDEMCEVENLTSVVVVAHVPERQASAAAVGRPATVSVDAIPGRRWPGIVQVVGSRLDEKGRTVPVHVLVDNRSGALKANMFATVSLAVGPGAAALTVDASALVQEGGTSVVYVEVEPGHFEERAVQTGRRQGDTVEVTSGLVAGEKVVVKGTFVLKSEKVKSGLKGHEH